MKSAVMELYDAGIRWVDMQLSRLSEALKKLDMWERCAFVFTADHGEEFLEHGGRFHPPTTMKEELIRVPLLVHVPGGAGRRISSQPFSHLDLAPTLLDLLRLPIPGEFQGRSQLRAWLDDRPEENSVVVVESAECANPNRPEERLAARVLCIRDTRYKLILRFSGGAELFDLAEDQGELRPLPENAAGPVRRRLLEHAHHHLRIQSTPHRPDAQLRAQLRELHTKMLDTTPLNSQKPGVC